MDPQGPPKNEKACKTGLVASSLKDGWTKKDNPTKIDSTPVTIRKVYLLKNIFNFTPPTL